MNYRHIYHAGNFADVFKHIILVALMQSLLRKDKPFCYLDTHAGLGRYDLLAEEAQRSQEFQRGIMQLLSQADLPNLIADYLNIIKEINQNADLRFYPGSPLVARSFLRKSDRMILVELHPHDFGHLKQAFFHDAQVMVYHQDGYQGLKAFLPPLERRGLVLIDPPYEKKDEFKQIIAALKNALQRWETGIYAVWYPLKSKIEVDNFYHDLEKIDHPILVAELNIYPKDVQLGLSGCGMAIINPPWQLDKLLVEIMPWLWSVLSVDKKGDYAIRWLKQED